MVGVVLAWWQELVVQCDTWRRLMSQNVLYWCYSICYVKCSTELFKLQLSCIYYIFSLKLSFQFNASLGRVIFFSLFSLNLGCMLFYTWHLCHGLDHLLSTQMFQQNMNSGCKLLSHVCGGILTTYIQVIFTLRAVFMHCYISFIDHTRGVIPKGGRQHWQTYCNWGDPSWVKSVFLLTHLAELFSFSPILS